MLPEYLYLNWLKAPVEVKHVERNVLPPTNSSETTTQVEKGKPVKKCRYEFSGFFMNRKHMKSDTNEIANLTDFRRNRKYSEHCNLQHVHRFHASRVHPARPSKQPG